MAKSRPNIDKQPKMRQKDYFELLRQQQNYENISRKLIPSTKQQKTKQMYLSQKSNVAEEGRRNDVFSSMSLRASSRAESHISSFFARPDSEINMNSPYSNGVRINPLHNKEIPIAYQNGTIRSMHPQNGNEQDFYDILNNKEPPRSILKKPRNNNEILVKSKPYLHQDGLYDNNNNNDNIDDLIFEGNGISQELTPSRDNLGEFISPRGFQLYNRPNSDYFDRQHTDRYTPVEHSHHGSRSYDDSVITKNKPNRMKMVRYRSDENLTKQNRFKANNYSQQLNTPIHQSMGRSEEQRRLYTPHIRPQLHQQGVVDFGTYISRKLSKLKLKKQEKEAKKQVLAPQSLYERVSLRDVRHFGSPKLNNNEHRQQFMIVPHTPPKKHNAKQQQKDVLY